MSNYNPKQSEGKNVSQIKRFPDNMSLKTQVYTFIIVKFDYFNILPIVIGILPSKVLQPSRILPSEFLPRLKPILNSDTFSPIGW
jgi:hypothetical protein